MQDSSLAEGAGGYRDHVVLRDYDGNGGVHPAGGFYVFPASGGRAARQDLRYADSIVIGSSAYAGGQPASCSAQRIFTVFRSGARDRDSASMVERDIGRNDRGVGT